MPGMFAELSQFAALPTIFIQWVKLLHTNRPLHRGMSTGAEAAPEPRHPLMGTPEVLLSGMALLGFTAR